MHPQARALALCVLLLSSRSALAQDFGSFEGTLLLEPTGDTGRDMKVVAPFAYVDGDKKIWTVPAGTVVDGASIPRTLWTIIGAPYTGQYREAAVVHDRYCENKERPWKEVHQAFYNGMRAKGVGYVQAQVMFAAVYSLGPRWVVSEKPNGERVVIDGTPRLDDTQKQKIEDYARSGPRSAADIAQFADKTVDPSELRTGQAPSDCGLVVPSAETSETAYLLCGLDKKKQQLNASHNLNILISDLKKLLGVNRGLLLPAIESYRQSPTPERWSEAQDRIRRTRAQIKLATMSAIEYDASLTGELGEETQALLSILRMRGIMLDELTLASAPITDPKILDDWLVRYHELISKLLTQTRQLQERVISGS